MKKIPLRQCVACREMKPKSELVRIVRSAEGEISLDPIGKKPGRGAYICREGDCLARAKKIRALERAFSAKIPDEVFERLENERSSADAEQ